MQEPLDGKTSVPSTNHGAMTEETSTPMQDHLQNAAGVLDAAQSESSPKNITLSAASMNLSDEPLGIEDEPPGIECSFESFKRDTAAAESSKKSRNVLQKHIPLVRKMSFASRARKGVVDEKNPTDVATTSKKPLKIILKKSSSFYLANNEIRDQSSLKQVPEQEHRRPFKPLDGNALTRVSSSLSLKKKSVADPESTSGGITESIQDTTPPTELSQEPLLYFVPLMKLATDIISSDDQTASNTVEEEAKDEQQVKQLKKRTMLRSFLVRQWLNATRSSNYKTNKKPNKTPSTTKPVRFHGSSQKLDDTFFIESHGKPNKRKSRKSKKYYYDDDEGLIGDVRDTLFYNMKVLKSVFSCFANNFSIEEEWNELQYGFEEEMVNYSRKLRKGTSELLHTMYDMNLLSEETVCDFRDDLRYQHANLEEHFIEFEDGLWNGIDKLYEKSIVGKERITESMLQSKNLIMDGQWYGKLNEDMNIMFQQLISDIQTISKLVVGDGYESLGKELRELMNESAKWFDDHVCEIAEKEIMTDAASGRACVEL
jgi:hypothetical protein